MHDIFLEKLGSENKTSLKGWPTYFRVNLFIFSLFILYTIYWYLQGGYRIPALGAIRFEFILGAALTLFAIAAYLKNQHRVKSGIGVWVMLLLIMMLIMVVFSRAPQHSYNIFVDRVIKFALLGFFVAAFSTTPTRLMIFIGSFLFACLKMGQEGFLGTITGSLVWENQGVMRLHGATPNYTHPNSFAGMALGTLPFIIYFYGIANRYFRIILLVQLIFSLNIILFTGSRTGYLALFFGLIFLVYKAQNRGRALILTLLLGAVFMPFIPSQYIERATTMLTQQDMQGNSINERKKILGDAWQIFLENPLGVGVSAFPIVRQERFKRSQDTHNLYLEVATNIGIQGFIIFVGFVFAMLKTLSRLISSINNQINSLTLSKNPDIFNHVDPSVIKKHFYDLKILSAASRATYVFIVIRLGLGFFGMDLYEVYWWFALGITTAIYNINKTIINRTNLLLNSSKYC